MMGSAGLGRRVLGILTGMSIVVVSVMTSASAAGPTVTVTPTSNLMDGQRLVIRGSGFDPYKAIQVLECNGTASNPPPDATYCEGTTIDSSGYTDRQGTYVNAPGGQGALHTTKGYLLFALPDAVDTLVNIHCGHPKDPPCVLYIGEDHNNFTLKHAFVPITFKGQAVSHGGSTAPIALAVLIVVGGAALGLWWRSRKTRRAGHAAKLAGS